MGKKQKTLFQIFGTAITVFCMFFFLNLMAHAEGIVVTPENFDDYYWVDRLGHEAYLMGDDPVDTITFKGDFTEVFSGRVERIIANRTIKYIGQEAVFDDAYFDVSADNVSISGFHFNIAEGVEYGVAVRNCNGFEFYGNSLTMKTSTVDDSYGIYAESSGNMIIKDNYMVFEGYTEGEAKNFAVYVSGNPSNSSVEVSGNTFDVSVVSCYMPWIEVPAGSGNWISRPVSGGLFFDGCHNLTVSKNTVNASYNKVVGDYDTINVIDIRGEKLPEGEDKPNVQVTDNIVMLNGNTYAYGLNIETDGFEVKGNEILVNANYYASGISLGENSFNGLVEQNNITAGVTEEGYFSSGLYVAMYNAEMEGITLRKNSIQLSGKIGYGIKCYSYIKNGNKLCIEENFINGDGGCMAGIAIIRDGDYEIKRNNIAVTGNATEEYEAYDDVYHKIKKTYGIALIRDGDRNSAEVSDNKIQSSDLGVVSEIASVINGNEISVQGEYTVDVYQDNKAEGFASKVFDNCLFAAKRKGDSSVYCTKVDEVYNNYGQKVTEVFSDVKEGEWYVQFIQFVFDSEIMTGKGGKFDPSGKIRREELTQIIYAHAGKPELAENTNNPFTDVSDKEWYCKGILWCANNGIVGGVGNNKFGVGQNVTREDFALMLYKYAQVCKMDSVNNIDEEAYKGYKDSDKVSKYAIKAMNWAITNGLISGKGTPSAPKSELSLDPKGNATRAEGAAMIMRFMEE